jgi:putative phosphoribosyl transferase
MPGRIAMFKDREDAGRRLAQALTSFKADKPVVLAIPRGGVAVGYRVAEHLRCGFSIIVVRKLPFPDNPEAGFGAIAEDGSTYLVDRAMRALSGHAIDRIINEQKREITRRIAVLRDGKPLPAIHDRTVILVDDGIAMGSTMRAAVSLCRNKKAKVVVVASPVAGPSVVADLIEIADHVIILETPAFFRAVAQAYANWYDVPDREVLELMRRVERR